MSTLPIPREQSKIVFKAESEEEKNSWMAALVMLNTKFMLERLLDVILSNEEKKHPLRFPPSDKYRFAEVNSDKNIVFEDKARIHQSSLSDLISDLGLISSNLTRFTTKQWKKEQVWPFLVVVQLIHRTQADISCTTTARLFFSHCLFATEFWTSLPKSDPNLAKLD